MDLAGNAKMGPVRGEYILSSTTRAGVLPVPPHLRNPSSAPNPCRITFPVLRPLTGAEHQPPSSAESVCYSMEPLTHLSCHPTPGDCTRGALEEVSAF